MNRFKYLSVLLFSVVLAVVIVVSCSKDSNPNAEDEGKNAGIEMCNCVSTIDAPAIPMPPAGFNPQNPDMEDPATLQYLALVQAIYEAYFAELGSCAGGVANKYQKYFVFSIANYDAEKGLFSAFDFKDEDFKNGFLNATQACAEAFEFR